MFSNQTTSWYLRNNTSNLSLVLFEYPNNSFKFIYIIIVIVCVQSKHHMNGQSMVVAKFGVCVFFVGFDALCTGCFATTGGPTWQFAFGGHGVVSCRGGGGGGGGGLGLLTYGLKDKDISTCLFCLSCLSCLSCLLACLKAYFFNVVYIFVNQCMFYLRKDVYI